MLPSPFHTPSRAVTKIGTQLELSHLASKGTDTLVREIPTVSPRRLGRPGGRRDPPYILALAPRCITCHTESGIGVPCKIK